MKQPLYEKGTEDIKVFTPQTTEDCSIIIDYLRGNPAIINFKNAPQKLVQRLIDVLCGAAYALHLGVCVLDKENLIIVEK